MRDPKVLLIDDDDDSRSVLATALEAAGFRVAAVERPERGLAEALAQAPDLVLCDVVMPALGGPELCRRLKEERRTAHLPVVLMSALRRGELEQALALECGADDYLVRPLHPRLLAARLRAVLGRGRPAVERLPALRAGTLAVDQAGRIARAAGRPLALTRKEFDLLAALVEKSGRVLGGSYLLETIWNRDPASEKDPHTLEVHVSSLRRKLGPRLSRRIVTVPGVGYRFDKQS